MLRSLGLGAGPCSSSIVDLVAGRTTLETPTSTAYARQVRLEGPRMSNRSKDYCYVMRLKPVLFFAKSKIGCDGRATNEFNLQGQSTSRARFHPT